MRVGDGVALESWRCSPMAAALADRVRDVAARVPRGRVATYKDVLRWAGAPPGSAAFYRSLPAVLRCARATTSFDRSFRKSVPNSIV